MANRTIAHVPLADLVGDEANARLHSHQNLVAIEDSLRQFGQVEPLVVQEGTGRVIGGNGRLAAMRELGWTSCDVVRVPLSDIKASALGIALNRTGELAEWDPEALEELLGSLKDEVELTSLGFSEEELEHLLQPDPELEEEATAAPETQAPEQPVAPYGRVVEHAQVAQPVQAHEPPQPVRVEPQEADDAARSSAVPRQSPPTVDARIFQLTFSSKEGAEFHQLATRARERLGRESMEATLLAMLRGYDSR